MSIAILVGPSGAGKTQTGEWAETDLGIDFLDADIFGANGIARFRLCPEWTDCLHGNARRLVETLRARAKANGRRGALLGLSSLVLFRWSRSG
jgi:hypothetical protein